MYQVTDKFAYNVPPKWKFLGAVRNTLDTKAKYDYYTPETCIDSIVDQSDYSNT